MEEWVSFEDGFAPLHPHVILFSPKIMVKLCMLQRLQIYCAERYLQSELWLMSMVFIYQK